MKAIFAWVSLLASLANLFDVASGIPEEPLAIGKMPGVEVNFCRLCIISIVFGSYFTQTKKYFKLTDIYKQLFKAEVLGAAVGIGPAEKLPVQPVNEVETGRLEEVFEKMPLKLPSSIEIAKGSILDKNLKTAR